MDRCGLDLVARSLKLKVQKGLIIYYLGTKFYYCSTHSPPNNGRDCVANPFFTKFSWTPVTLTLKQGHINWHAQKAIVTYYTGAKFDDFSTASLFDIAGIGRKSHFFMFVWTPVTLTLAQGHFNRHVQEGIIKYYLSTKFQNYCPDSLKKMAEKGKKYYFFKFSWTPVTLTLNQGHLNWHA